MFLKSLSVLLLSLLATSLSAQGVPRLATDISWLQAQNVRAAFEEMCANPQYNAAAYEPMLKELEALCAQGFEGMETEGSAASGRAKRALALQRTLLLSNPLLDNAKIIAGRYVLGAKARSASPVSLGTQANNWSNQTSSPREGFDARIVELSNLRGEIACRTIYKPANSSSVSDLLLHWDADRLLFTASDERKRWNVFEVKLDGSGLRKVIACNEPDLEFFDGTYLPDGRFIAVSNIGYQGVPCVNGSDAVGNLVAYDPASGSLRRMTFDQDANWHPTVMNNGRLMYVRWEYTDLTHYCSRFVMHANPDGTETRSLYGSGSWFPNSTFDIKPLPGATNAFVGIISGHHGVVRAGRMITFDPDKSRKEEKGMLQEFPFSKRPIVPLVKDELVEGVWPQFIKPWPISQKYFLVAAKLDPKSLWGIYLVDVFDNLLLIAEYENEGLIQPVLVQKRPTPPAIPDKFKPGEKNATLFIQDIYEGEGLPGVPRGTVKQLRVFAYEYAYIRSPSDHTAQGIQSGWDIKRLLGTVDVEADGSAIFTIPANTPISLQPLDSEGRAIQWMRSWLTAMPGEIVSCVGCHEDQNSFPIPKRVIASQKKPIPITPPEGGVRSFTYDLEIQPILDRACLSCHNGRAEPDLRGGIKVETSPSNKGNLKLSTSYLALHPYVNRQGPEADIAVMKPYEYHASTSELVKLLKQGHKGVTLTDAEWRTLYNWIDFNAPYHGAFVAEPDAFYGCEDQIARRIELTNKYANNAGVDWQKELADYAAFREKQGSSVAEQPKREAQIPFRPVEVQGFPFTPEPTEQKEVEIAPGVSITFVKIPSGAFVMGNNRRGGYSAPECKVEIEKSFWMSATEITNQQYRVFFPQHDSRYIAQLWKDHVKPGYPANNPSQPVIRISWNQAAEYCNLLSRKSGLKCCLPTEAQWEWAARAGSATPFWFGASNADFSPYENLADKQLSKMAVTGIDPQPMAEDNPNFPFYNFLLRSRNVDDGSMIVAEVARYKPNPWGLYDMHGNVQEWTRSDFVPYPYEEKAVSDQHLKVVRGGSWIDRPKNAASYTRNGYYAWQPANNVGFRIVLEE